jgi:hypothetical protein
VTIRSLEFDYFRPALRARMPRYTLAMVAVSFSVCLGWHYNTLHREVDTAARRLASVRPSHPAPARVSLLKADPAEFTFARDTVARLSMPWDRLFGALEAANIDQVALLSVEPDAQARTVTITGEGRDYLAALSYMANLAGQKDLNRVHLVRHEVKREASTRPLTFTVSAAWRDAR